jgi:hypothetical protein
MAKERTVRSDLKAPIQLRSYGNLYLPSIVNVQLFTLISACLIQSRCPAHVIGLWVKKRERPTILRDLIVRYDNEYQDWLEKPYPFSKKLENHIGAIWNFIHYYNASLPPLSSFLF